MHNKWNLLVPLSQSRMLNMAFYRNVWQIRERPGGAYSLKVSLEDCSSTTTIELWYLYAIEMFGGLSVSKIYDGIIREQEERGFIEKLAHISKQSSVDYIPYHPVRKESSTTP